jgi:uncharacterized surface protein with fasciclin (FAS1) repeats
MRLNIRNTIFVALALSFLGAGCKKLTEEHNAVTDPALTKTLMEVIDANSDLTTFAGYLKQTGYDKELNSTKSFTVFAPTNSQLVGVDQAILNSASRLKQFIANHIAGQKLLTTEVTTTTRVGMLSGKYNAMQGATIEGLTISTKDKYASNGVLQIINGVLPALDNCWEFMTNNTAAPSSQSIFMQSLFRNVFDPTNAITIGVNQLTGDPIYQAGTDSVFTNLFWNQVHDLRNEKKQYSYFMLTDAAWNTEVNKFLPYFQTTTTDSSMYAANWNVVKDFAVDTLYNPATIPDTIYSKSGTKLGIDRSAIVRTVKTSNGVVFIMSKLDVQPLHKFKTYIIEAENYTAASHDRRGNTYFRDRNNVVTTKDFRDVLVLGHGVALFNLRYAITEMPKVKYKAYWVALNDFQTATFTQKLGIGDATSTTFAYTTVALNNFNEVYIGEFANARYWPKYNIYLTAANSTTAAVNPLVCDYIKLVPGL